MNVPHSQSMRRSTSYNYNTPRYHGPSSPKIDLLPADSKASDSQDMQGDTSLSDLKMSKWNLNMLCAIGSSALPLTPLFKTSFTSANLP